MKILLVEDDHVDAMLIERWLRPHSIEWVSSAAEAVPKINSGHDLILCDMGLPDSITLPGDSSSTTATEVLSSAGVPLVKYSGCPRDGVCEKTRESLQEAIASRVS